MSGKPIMNHNRKRVFVAASFLGLLLCIGVLGALFLVQQDKSGTHVRNQEVLRSDQGNRNVEDSKAFGSPDQDGSTTPKSSLFGDLNEYSNSFDSKRALLSFADGATVHELVGLFRESLELPMFLGSIRATHWLQGIVLTKLVTIDINKASSLLEQLDSPATESVLYRIMREWNQVHSDEAVKLLSSFDRRLIIRGFRGLVDGGNFLSRSKLLEIGTELGFEEKYVIDLLDRPQKPQIQISWNELAAEFERVDTKDAIQMIELRRQASSYVLAEGLNSLSSVLELYDNLSSDNLSSTDRISLDRAPSRLLGEIAQNDPEEVFEFVVQLGKKIDVDLISQVAAAWFVADPDALWKRLSRRDLKDIQDEITQDVIRYWSLRGRDETLISLEKFPSKYHDQVFLQVAQFVSMKAPFDALELLPHTSDWSEPEKESNSIGNFSFDFSTPDFATFGILSAAAREDPIATMEWINSEESKLHASMKQHHLNVVVLSWTGSDPLKAFEIALQTPLKEGTAGPEADVVGGMLRKGDVDQAIALLPRVRDGETKADAYRSVSWKLEELDRIDEAIQLGGDLPEHDREKYNQSIAWRVGDRTPYNYLLAGIRQLPSQELQSEAARSAISSAMMSNDFNEQQTNRLKEFLTDEDKQVVDRMQDLDRKAIMEKLPEELPTTEEGIKKLLKDLEIELNE